MSNQEEELFLESIRNGKLNEVEKYFQQHPKPRPIFTHQKESAAAIALKSNQIEIYKILKKHGLDLDSEENIKDIMKSLPIETRLELREFYDKHCTDFDLDHLAVLNKKSKLAHHHSNQIDKNEFPGLIAKAFLELNEMKWIEPILKFVALAANLSIKFDFTLDTIEHMDPSKYDEVEGACYHKEGCIYIGAKNLVRHEYRLKALGVMAHEICHFAMQLLYKNSCKPYHHQSELEKNIESILIHADLNKTHESCIEIVFDYPETERHAELIVRVPHMLVLYKEDEERIEDIKARFSQLFEFYESKILIDIEREYPLLESRNLVKAINCKLMILARIKSSDIAINDNSFGKFEYSNDKVYSVFSNCPPLTMLMIYQQSTKSEHENHENFIFVKLEQLNDDEIFELIKKALNSCSKPKLIVDCAEEKIEEIYRLHGKLIGNGLMQGIALIHNYETLKPYGAENLKKMHCWTELTAVCQDNLLKTQIVFQGHKMHLGQILKTSPELCKHLNLSNLLAKDVNIEIGKPVKFDEVEHFERKFLPPGSFRLQGSDLFSSEMNLNGFLNTVDHFKIKTIILSDEPGMGKSTEFKFLAKKLKQRLPSYWVEFIDLKLFYKAFLPDGKVMKQFKTCSAIANYFCRELLKIEGFEAKVFTHLLKEGSVIFLMDGFDEISPSFKEFNLALFEKILKMTSNQLWVSTRPHLENELVVKLKVNPHKIRPLSLADRAIFIRQILKNKKIDDRLIDAKVREIERFLLDLGRTVFDPFGVTNPIILSMVVKIFENNPEAKLMQVSYYSIYKGFVNRMIKNCMKKGFDALNDSAAFIESVDIKQIYEREAFRAVLNIHNADIKNAIESCFDIFTEITEDSLSRIGLMTIDGSGRSHFIHLTFADYFVAKFLLEKVFASKDYTDIAAPIVKLLKIILTEPMLRMIRVFIDSGIETQSLDSTFIQNILSQNFSPKELCQIFRNAIQEGSITFARAISKHFASDTTKLNRLWLFKVDELFYPNAFLKALSVEKSIEFLEQLLALAREDLDDLSYKKIFLDVDLNKLNIFHLVVQNKSGLKSPGYFEFFLTNQLVPLSNDEKLEFLTAKTKNGSNLLIHAICNYNTLEVPRILKLIKDEFGFENVLTVLKVDSSAQHFFNTWKCLFEWVSIESVMKNFLDEMLETFTSQENEVMFFTNESFITNSIEMAACVSSSENILNEFWEFFEKVLSDAAVRRNFLMQEKSGLTAFHYATMNPNEKVFIYMKEKYCEFFNEANMINLLIKVNSSGENILFMTASTSNNDRTFAAVWSYMKTLLDSKKLKQMLLHRNVQGLLFSRVKVTKNSVLVPKVLDAFIEKNLSENEKSLFIIDQYSGDRINIRNTVYMP